MLNHSAIDDSLRALAEPTRRAMIDRLARGPATVSELARPFAMSLAAIVQHLKVLEDTGFVVSQKVGRVRTCRLETAGLDRVAGWVAERRALAERRLDRLGALLDEMEGNETDNGKETDR